MVTWMNSAIGWLRFFGGVWVDEERCIVTSYSSPLQAFLPMYESTSYPIGLPPTTSPDRFLSMFPSQLKQRIPTATIFRFQVLPSDELSSFVLSDAVGWVGKRATYAMFVGIREEGGVLDARLFAVSGVSPFWRMNWTILWISGVLSVIAVPNFGGYLWWVVGLYLLGQLVLAPVWGPFVNQLAQGELQRLRVRGQLDIVAHELTLLHLNEG